MEFRSMIMVMVLLATTVPTFYAARAPSHMMRNRTEPIRTGFLVKLLHRNHPEMVRQFGGELVEPLTKPDQVLPIEKVGKLVYYASFLVGSESEPVSAVYDTGSGFTVLKLRSKWSSTYQSLACRSDGRSDTCTEVPGHICRRQCGFEYKYNDGTAVVGNVGTDQFHFFQAIVGGHDPDPTHTVAAKMVFGSTNVKMRHPGIMGVTDQPLGVLTALRATAFSSCFPKNDEQPSYVRMGYDQAFLDGDNPTPLVDGFGHYAFRVNTITIGGDTFAIGGFGPFIFDTGSSETRLHPTVMDVVVEQVRKSVKATPELVAGYYELCYDSFDKKAYEGLKVTLNVDGGGSLPFNFYNLWRGDGSHHCLAFSRSTKKETVFGVWQMRGWNFGIDLDRGQLYFQLDETCST